MTGQKQFLVCKRLFYNTSEVNYLLILAIGSENGACWGFFLAQHKSQLGNLVVEKIQVFKNDRDSNPDPDLLFYVESVPSE